MLGLLANGPLHGYELKGAYESVLAPTANLNIGQVYTTLDRLHRDGLVKFAAVNQSERPDKKVFSVTPAGRKQLDKWFDEPLIPGLEDRNATFLKLILAKRIKKHDPLICLANERDACFRRLQEVTKAKADAEQDEAPYQTILLLELAILRLDAFLKWLDRCEEVFTSEQLR